MKQIIVAALFVVLFVLGAAAQAEVCTLVRVGSADADFGEGGPPNNDANLSLVAAVACDGTVKGQFQDTLAGGIGMHASVTCVEVDGNDVWISGVIRHAFPESLWGGAFDGLPINIRFRDNGTSAHDPPDQASAWVFAETPTDCTSRLEFDLWNLNNGQVQIMER